LAVSRFDEFTIGGKEHYSEAKFFPTYGFVISGPIPFKKDERCILYHTFAETAVSAWTRFVGPEMMKNNPNVLNEWFKRGYRVHYVDMTIRFVVEK
jgi:hypothetical protein